MWMLFLSCLCASTGSTGGGIKMFRALVLVKQSLREMFTLVHPQAVAPLKIAGQLVPNRVVYLGAGVHLPVFHDHRGADLCAADLGAWISTSSVSAIIACINNAGPGLSVVGPGSNYGTLNDFQTLGVHRGHVSGPRGNLHRAGAVHADVLAQMIRCKAPL